MSENALAVDVFMILLLWLTYICITAGLGVDF